MYVWLGSVMAAGCALAAQPGVRTSISLVDEHPTVSIDALTSVQLHQLLIRLSDLPFLPRI